MKMVMYPITQLSFLSTPSARRATRLHREQKRRILISIHALREEGDLAEMQNIMLRAISIHALREEGDSARKSYSVLNRKFLSTPSARRAT